MNCQTCKSGRIFSFTAKCSDCFGGIINDKSHEGYVPSDMGICGGDYVEMAYCLNCGQIQGKFPLPVSKIECGK